MSFLEYIIEKRKYLLALLFSSAAVGGFLWLVDVRRVFIAFAMVMWLFPLVLVGVLDFFHKKNYYDGVKKRMERLDQKTLLAEVMETPDFLEGNILYEILMQTDLDMNNRIAKQEQSVKEYREYVEAWVHEIKTPLTAANLLVEKSVAEEKKQIAAELDKVDGLVEQALYYARSTSVANDFLAEKTTLQELVSQALKSQAKTLIRAKTRPKMEDLDAYVYADTKWIGFILNQILTNAVKYKKQDAALELTFSGKIMPEGVSLEIRDNGIGIPKEDVERIFEKGFTGKNGRIGAKSTGIGLYLCKKLCEKMNLQIRAESAFGQGTSIILVFPVGSMTQI